MAGDMLPSYPPMAFVAPVLLIVAAVALAWQIGARAWRRRRDQVVAFDTSETCAKVGGIAKPERVRWVVHPDQADLHATLDLASRFYREFAALLPHRPPMDAERLARFCRMVLESMDAAVIFAEREVEPDVWEAVGMIAVLAVQHPLSGEMTLDELAWFIREDARGGRLALKLHEAAESFARSKDCSMIKMVAPHGSSAGAYYDRRGYIPVETAWYKSLR